MKSKYSNILTKKYLYREYIIKNKSSLQISKEIGSSVMPILYWLRKYNIQRKTVVNYPKSKKHRKILSKLAKKRIGIKAHNYKHGLNCIKHYCKCGKEITAYAKICLKCHNIAQLGKSQNKGKNNPMFGVKGRNAPAFGKSMRPKIINYKGCKFYSSWEVKFAQFLSLSNIRWQYEPKTFDLGNTTYTPDFYIPEWNLYIEIKGYLTLEAKKKINSFKKIYSDINFKIFFKKELEELSVL